LCCCCLYRGKDVEVGDTSSEHSSLDSSLRQFGLSHDRRKYENHATDEDYTDNDENDDDSAEEAELKVYDESDASVSWASISDTPSPIGDYDPYSSYDFEC